MSPPEANQDRGKPGVAFWATVVLSLPVLYVMSFGPACQLANRHMISTESITFAYKPILNQLHNGPKPVRRTLAWYAGFSHDKITYLELDLECLIRR